MKAEEFYRLGIGDVVRHEKTGAQGPVVYIKRGEDNLPQEVMIILPRGNDPPHKIFKVQDADDLMLLV